MEIVSGMKIAAAIDDLATTDLEDAEQALADQLTEEIAETFGVSYELIPKRLINGMMRGSTSLKLDQIVDEIHRMQGRINDDRDAESLATQILNSVERQRRDIHRQRTARSAVRQVLRALSSEALRSPSFEEWNSSSLIRMQSELQDQSINSPQEIFEWGALVLRLYYDLFVEQGKQDSSLIRKPKGQVSQGAAKNYASAWNRFIDEKANEIYLHARSGRMIEDSFNNKREKYVLENTLKAIIDTGSPSKTSINRKPKEQFTSFAMAPNAYKEELSTNYSLMQAPGISSNADTEGVTVLITENKNNDKPSRIEKTWPTREDALLGLTKFFIIIEGDSPGLVRFDQVDISITVNGKTETLTLEEIDPARLKSTLKTLLTD
jgi:hypothetical protein